MDYLIGALMMTLLFAAFAAGYHFGGKRRMAAPKEVDEQEAHKAKQLREGFNELMSYDVNKAVTGKR